MPERSVSFFGNRWVMVTAGVPRRDKIPQIMHVWD